MGMFDYVRVECRLPCKRETEIRTACNPFQSKSVRLWESERWGDKAYDEGCVTMTLADDRTLRGPDGEIIPWSGGLIFYGSGQRVKWAEFTASIRDGHIIEIAAYDIPERFK